MFRFICMPRLFGKQWNINKDKKDAYENGTKFFG